MHADLLRDLGPLLAVAATSFAAFLGGFKLSAKGNGRNGHSGHNTASPNFGVVQLFPVFVSKMISFWSAMSQGFTSSQVAASLGKDQVGWSWDEGQSFRAVA